MNINTSLLRESEQESAATENKKPHLRVVGGGGSVDGLKEVSLADFVAYMPQHNYIYKPTREVWPASSVNSRCTSPDKRDPSEWLDANAAVEQMTWAPGESMLIRDRLVDEGGWFEHKGATSFNLYRPPHAEPGDASRIGLWLELVNRLWPDEASHIIKWLAHRVQHPAVKINHALVLVGEPGIGKDSILEPAKYAVGPWNFAEVGPEQLVGRFNGFLKSVVLRVSEAHDLGEIDRYKFYEHTKTMIAAPPDVLRVDEKNLREHSIPNVTGVVILSNHKCDGIYLPPDDRRHFVAWSNLTKNDFEVGYWTKLYRWYDGEGRQNVAEYLRSVDISDFDPKAPPPQTAAFWEIVDASRPAEDGEIADLLDSIERPEAITLGRLFTEAVGTELFDWLKDRKNRRIVGFRLEKAGYVRVVNDADQRDGHWRVDGKRQAVYAKAELSVRDRVAAVGRLVSGR